MLKNPKASEKMKQSIQEKMEEGETPESRDLLWLIFWDLFTGELTTYTEIQSYLHLSNLSLNPYEVELLRSMDSTACGAVSEIRYPKTK